MKFKNKIIKLIIRYSKEKNKYQEFKKFFEQYICTYSNKPLNEKDAINIFYKNNIDNCLVYIPYTIKLSGNYNRRETEFEKYLFEIYKTEIINLFETFLKTNNLYDRYFSFVDENFIKKHVINANFEKCNTTKEKIYKNLTPIGFIIDAFLWSQGGLYDIWSTANRKWHKLLIDFYKTM